MHYWYPYPTGRICEYCEEVQEREEFCETVCSRAAAYLRHGRLTTV